MFDRIIRFSIDNKLFVGITIFFLIISGLYCVFQVPVDAVPDITNNQVQVVTISPSLAPQEVEKLITYPVEVAMANILNVIEIRSISRFGLSVVTVVFKDHVPILEARQLVNEQIQIVANDLPDGIGKPQLMPITTGLGEIFQYSLEVDESYKNRYTATDLRTIQDWIVKRQLSGIPGIVEISSFGGYLKQYEVAVDPVKMNQLDVVISEVYDALEQNNQNSGGSYIEKYNNAYYIRAEGVIQKLQDIENIVIKNTSNVPVLVKDIAEVRFGHAPRFGAMTKNGKGEAVGGITLMLKGANSSKVIGEVKKRVEKVEKMLPPGVHIKPYLDRSVLVAKTIRTVSKNLLEGGLIVIFVLVLLLGNFRAGLIVASVIPLSLLFAFIMMYIFGVSANLMSLGAIDFGIVIDGAVIIVESIVHYIFTNHKGAKITQADMDNIVYKSSSQIYKSAAFGVFIIIIVFFPIISLTGIEGKMFRPMAQTVTFAILGAFLLSLTYVPMISSLFLSKNIIEKRTISDRIIDFLKLTYKPVLQFVLRFKYGVLTAAIIIFAISVWGFMRMGGEFLPTLEEGDLAMQMSLPPGSSLTESMEIAERAEETLIENFPEVKQVISKIGTAEVPTDPMAVEDADIMIVLKEKDEWVSAKTREELVDKMKAKLSVVTGASFDFTQPIQLRFNELMTGAKTDIAVKIYGEDMDELYDKANQAASLISKIPGAADIKVEQITGLPQLVVKYDREKIAKYGLNIMDLNTIVRTAYAGEAAGVVFEGEKKFDLVVRFNHENRTEVNLKRLFVRLNNGNQIPLSEVANVYYLEGPMQVSRDDTKRRITIGINVRNKDIETLVNEIKTELDTKLVLKPGYNTTYGGQFQNLENAKKRLQIAIPLALGLIMLLLFFTFNSLKYAFIIFSAVPLSAVGGIGALAIRGMPFSISAGVGFIALFGVAVLNGIVLISYYNQLMKQGDKTLMEVVEAGALSRLRPVMMTALVASLGFLPMAISTSAGGEVQKPLATVVIGGLITSTLLTMLIMPILYTIFNSPKPSAGWKPIKLFKSKKGIAGAIILLGTFSVSLAQETNAKTITLNNAIATAIKNHPAVKNAELNVQAANAQRRSILELGPTSLLYEYGQINSAINDNYLEVSQDFGSPFSFIQKGQVIKKQIALSKAEQQIIINDITAKVKIAWFQWIYSWDKLSLIKNESALYSDFLRIAQLHHELGETDLLEKTMAETKFAEIQSRMFQAEEDFKIYTNLIKQLLCSNENIMPADTSLELYPIQTSKADSNKFSPDKHVTYYEQNYLVKKAEAGLERSKYLPAISGGYFNQQIDDVKGFEGFKLGVSVPIWFLPQSAKIKEAAVKREIASNELEYQKFYLAKRIENLKTQLDQIFVQISYYRENALKQADLLEKTATLQYKKQDIEYFEYIQSISTAYSIRLNYLEKLLNYNTTAVELEYLVN
jgi:cobalt-zinc-cadmium resistance protein CzcA